MNGSEIWNELGNIYLKVGAWDEAINAYSRAIELLGDDPDTALSWNRLGWAYRQLEDLDKAAVAFGRAVELDPENSLFQSDLGELQSSLMQAEAPVPVEGPAQDDPATAVPYVEATDPAEAVFAPLPAELADEAVTVDPGQEVMDGSRWMPAPPEPDPVTGPAEPAIEAPAPEAIAVEPEAVAAVEAESAPAPVEEIALDPAPVAELSAAPETEAVTEEAQPIAEAAVSVEEAAVTSEAVAESDPALEDTQPTGIKPVVRHADGTTPSVAETPPANEPIELPEAVFTGLEATPEVVQFRADLQMPVDESAPAGLEADPIPSFMAFGGMPTEIAMDQIDRNPRQPRADVEVDELLESVRAHGILQPLIATPGGEPGRYVLISGERRLEAARQAGLQNVPVIVRSASDEQLLELALIENVQRSDLNPMELAEAYRQLADEFELSHEEIALRVGKSRVAVTNTLRLLKLSDAVKGALVAKQITEGHARSLLRLATAQLQDAMLEYIVRNDLSVRKVEELVRELKGETVVEELLGPAAELVVAPEVVLEEQPLPVQQETGAAEAVENEVTHVEVTVTMTSAAETAAEPERNSPEPVRIGELDEDEDEEVPEFNVIELDPPEWWQTLATEAPADAAPEAVAPTASSDWVPEESIPVSDDAPVAAIETQPAMAIDASDPAPEELPLESPVAESMPVSDAIGEVLNDADAGVSQEELEDLIEATIAVEEVPAIVMAIEAKPLTEADLIPISVDMEPTPEQIALDLQDSPATSADVLEAQPAVMLAAEEPEVKATALAGQLGDAQNDSYYVDGAIAAYRKVTEINPNNDRAWDALGNFCSTLGRYHDAVVAFEKAISLDPEREVYHYHLGLVHAAQKRYDDAIAAFQKAIALNSEYTFAHCALAGYYRRLGQEDEAQKHITIALPKMRAEKEYNRACFEAICGNTDQAIELLGVALEKKQTPVDWVCRDPDLESIRDDPRFRALVARSGVKTAAGAAPRSSSGRSQPWWLTATAP